MNQLLEIRQKIRFETDLSCEVEAFLGGGGQGEVYRVRVDGKQMALKWYFPKQATPEQRASLELLVKNGPPTGKFLWPLGLIEARNISGFGYIMPLRDPHYKSIVDLMKRRTEPTFRALITAGLELAQSFLHLHAKGLCYRDISFGNVFFDPDTGEVLICDNDNVTVDGNGRGGVLGTPRFMAPEIVRGEASPDTRSDLFSLAVLLFYMLMIHHPLEGRKEAEIKCFDFPAMNRLYGTEPLFIFDPANDANRPMIGYHDNAIIYWAIYPQFVRDIFIKAFTDGIRDPQNGRVRESEWRAVMTRLRDAVIYCGSCGAENFYDIDKLRTDGHLNPCWSCQKAVQPPPRIRIDRNVVMLNHDTQLFPHHTDPDRAYDFSAPVAVVTRHPSDPNIWGLQNLSTEKWSVTSPDGSVRDVAPGRSATMTKGLRINFGKIQGEIRV